jgi:hypothetical protein
MKTGAPKSEFPAIFGWCETFGWNVCKPQYRFSAVESAWFGYCTKCGIFESVQVIFISKRSHNFPFPIKIQTDPKWQIPKMLDVQLEFSIYTWKQVVTHIYGWKNTNFKF